MTPSTDDSDPDSTAAMPVSRRRALAALGSALLAGCGATPGSSPDAVTDRSTASPTRTDAPTRTATRTTAGPETTAERETTAGPETTAERETTDGAETTGEAETETTTDSATATETPVPEASFELGAADWSAPVDSAAGAWPLPAYDARGTRAAPGANAPSSFPLERTWEATFPESRTGVALAGSDGLYAVVGGRPPDGSGDDEDPPATVVARVDPETGERSWVREHSSDPESSPALDGGECVVALDRGTATAFDARDGAARSVDLPDARFGRQLLASGGILYATADDENLHAFDAGSGERCFTFDGGEIDVGAPVAEDVQDWTVHDFAADDDHAYVATAAHYNDELPPDLGKVFALDPMAGEIAWTARLAPDNETKPTPARRVAVSDGRVYVASESGLWALSAADGGEVWKTGDLADRIWGFETTVAAATVYAVNHETVWAIDATTGQTRWQKAVTQPTTTAAAGDRLFLRTGPRDGPTTLLAYDADGTERWRHETDATVDGLTPAHGRLYAGTVDGRLLAFE